MNHIVDTCQGVYDTYPLTKFEGGLKLLHEADEDTVIWQESTATTALVKRNEMNSLSFVLQDARLSYILCCAVRR